jgi:threonine dehydratase
VFHPFVSPKALVRRTTFIPARRLARHLGFPITLVTETFQETGSFAIRAADHIAANVSAPVLITTSFGNFGQALACACLVRKKSCIVVAPSTCPARNIHAIREYHGQVEFVDLRLQSLAERVIELTREYRGAYVTSPSDDALAIEGIASLGREIASLKRNFERVVTPIGGGALASGIVVGLRDSGNKSFVVGAEPLIANDAARSFKQGEIVANSTEPETLADGARNLRLGRCAWPILYRSLFDIVEVPEEKIAEAMRLLFELANLKAEPTGALGLAAVLSEPQLFRDRSVCCIVSGGNVCPALYQTILGGH